MVTRMAELIDEKQQPCRSCPLAKGRSERGGRRLYAISTATSSTVSALAVGCRGGDGHDRDILVRHLCAFDHGHRPFDPARSPCRTPTPPAFQDGGRWMYLLGTDRQGRDMFASILYGRASRCWWVSRRCCWRWSSGCHWGLSRAISGASSTWSSCGSRTCS